MTTVQQAQPNIDAALIALDAEECRRSLKSFVKAVWHIIEPKPFIDGWVIDCLCLHLDAVTRGEIRKLLINIPPRHSKSTISVIWRVWNWLHNPAEQILGASFDLGLALRDNVKCRRIIEDPWFQERYGDEFQLASDQNVKSYFENTARGYQMAISVNAGTTGRGGSILVLDDPHNASEAYSEADREAALMWFREVWTNRLNDQAHDKMVVIGQRIHEDDVSGYIIKERPDWVYLNLPAEFEPARRCFTPVISPSDEPYSWKGCDPRQAEGELLWIDRFSQQSLDGLKRDLGTNGYAAQYQQGPVPATGGTFQEAWKRYFEIQDDYYLLHTKYGRTKAVKRADCQLIAVNDPAISEREESDFWVLQIWAVTPDNEILLLFQLRGHFHNPDQQKHNVEQYERYLYNALYVETVAYQLALYQQLKNYDKEEEVEPGLYRKHKVYLPVKEWKPIRDKVARAGVAAIKMEAGDMYFLFGAAYLLELEPEVFKFPKAPKKDQVDCLGMICDILSNPGLPLEGVETPEKPKPPTIAEILKTDAFAWAAEHGMWGDA